MGEIPMDHQPWLKTELARPRYRRPRSQRKGLPKRVKSKLKHRQKGRSPRRR